MFREMRRRGQLLPDAEAEAILASGSTGVLSVLGDGGYPYAVPLNYAYSEGKLYFHCAKSGHKLDAIRACDKVSFCVVAEDCVIPETLSTRYRSVIVFGRARILETEEELRRAARAIGEKYGCGSDEVEREIDAELPVLCCVEITPESVTGKEAKALAQERAKKE